MNTTQIIAEIKMRASFSGYEFISDDNLKVCTSIAGFSNKSKEYWAYTHIRTDETYLKCLANTPKALFFARKSAFFVRKIQYLERLENCHLFSVVTTNRLTFKDMHHKYCALSFMGGHVGFAISPNKAYRMLRYSIFGREQE